MSEPITLSSIASDIEFIQATIFNYLPFTVGIILFLALVNFINQAIGGRLFILGIIPRHIFGLIGIFCSPFIHGSFNHLFFNSIPLFFLMNMVLMYGFNVFLAVTLSIMVIAGGLTWLFGRHALHVGASGVILGYFGFLVIVAYLVPSFLSIMLLVLTLYYFGGLVASLVPIHTQGVSVEGHIFGFIAGIATYFLLPYLPVQ